MTANSPSTTSTKERITWAQGLGLFRRFWPYLRPERRLTALIALLTLLAVPSGAIAPFLVQRIFDDALPAQDVRFLGMLGLGIVGLTLLAHLLRYLESLVSLSLRNRVRFRVSTDLFDHVLRLPLRWHHNTDTGYLMSRLRDDVAALDGIMTDTLVGASVDVLRALLFLTLLLVLDPGLAVSGLVLVVLIFGGVLLVSPALRRRSERAREADARNSAALHESLTGLGLVRTAAAERPERRRWAATVKAAIRTQASRDVLGIATGSSIGLLGTLGGYVIVAVGAYRILLGLSTFGSLFAFFIFLVELVGAAGSVLSLAPALQRSLASLERIFAIQDQHREPDDREAVTPADPIRGHLELRNVSFRYAEDCPDALDGVSLAIEPGEVVALVGRSGAGKSTLARLIPRLFEPSSGELYLDGLPLSDYPLRWLRRQIGVVPQEIFLFDRSVRENLAYNRPDASEEEIREAARLAHAEEFIDALPQGFDSVVGERGVRLSGGERQRLAIAREVLRNPPLLILDEATSNLDSESEDLVREAMARLMSSRTCLVIAHRLSTVRAADRIVVLDQGRIIEQGRHQDLLEQNGLYAELHQRQFGDQAAAHRGSL